MITILNLLDKPRYVIYAVSVLNGTGAWCSGCGLLPWNHEEVSKP